MKTFLKAITIILAIFVAVGLFLPTQYQVTKSKSIKATPEQIHHYVGDLDQWPEWSPWEKSDPSIKITAGKKRTGIGASQSWKGDSGDGELTFTYSSPQLGIRYDMMFDGADPSKAEMIYKPSADGESTLVTWTINGELTAPVIGGYFALIINGMIEPMFEDGLQRLKTVVEKKD